MTHPPKASRVDRRALCVAAALMALAAFLLKDAVGQTITATYGVGPAAMPMVIAGLLAALAVAHIAVAFRGGLPKAPPLDPAAVGWVATGLAILVGCLAFGGGFIAAATFLFATTARAFGRRALFADLAIGFVIGVVIHLAFSKLLTLALPAGPLERLL
jgi:putative tricarboxylic transport membrane protein